MQTENSSASKLKGTIYLWKDTEYTLFRFLFLSVLASGFWVVCMSRGERRDLGRYRDDYS